MRPLLLLAAFLSPFLAAAQPPLVQTPPPQGSNWQHVQALPAGTSIYVSANKHTTRCSLTSVDVDSLTCTHGKPVTFKRTEITSIKLPRHTLSTLIMAGIGAGVSVGVVKGVSQATGWGGTAKGSVYAGGAGLGAIVFGSIGYLTDFARSAVYKAP